MAIAQDLPMWHLDLWQACIGADLRSDAYVKPPRGRNHLSGKVPHHPFGLKQVRRMFHALFVETMIVKDTRQCNMESCVSRLMDGDALKLLLS